MPLSLTVSAQDQFLDKVLYLTGASDLEELDAQVLERYEHYHEHPVNINLASKSALSSTGLLSPYQLASLMDYIGRSGDVLSSEELALIDGFGRQTAQALEPFVSFYSDKSVGHTRGKRTAQTALLSTSVKRGDWRYSTKYRMTSGRVDIGLNTRTGYGENFFPPSSYGLFATLYGRKHFGKLIVGDFNARFGQGLSLWSGFSMSGLSSVSSFVRRPSGLSPSLSYSDASYRGVAIDMNFGRFTLSAMTAFTGLRPWCEKGKPIDAEVFPAVNLAWLGRNGQVSLTGFYDTRLVGGRHSSKVSADARFCFRGVDYFGELAYDMACGRMGGVAGSIVPIGKVRLALSGRFYQEGFDAAHSGAVRSSTKATDEAGAAVGWDWRKTSVVVDASKRLSEDKKQLKLIANQEWSLSKSFLLRMRLSQRLRNYGQHNRTDARADLVWTVGNWLSTVRANAVFCEYEGLLGYLESGYKDAMQSAFLRLTFFRADDWDDRIYCYERDAPGTFNVPAFYGRGCAASVVGSRKFRLSHGYLKSYLRAETTQYPWNKTKKRGYFAARLQLMYDF